MKDHHQGKEQDGARLLWGSIRSGDSRKAPRGGRDSVPVK